MARLAPWFAVGSLAALHLGAVLPALAVLLLLAPPIRVWRRPPHRPLLLALAAGVVAGGAGGADRCPGPPSGPATIFGRFVAPTRGTTPLVRDGVGPCRTLRVWTDATVPAGRSVRVEGVLRDGGPAGPLLLARSVRVLHDPAPGPMWRVVRWRGSLVERAHALYPERGAVVSALILARREGLDPDLRDAFARAGTAHLLAISGFHVGVVAGLILVVLRVGRVGRRRARLLAAAGTWGYVALLGAPAAATRAATIVTLTALASARGRPAARWGALSTAFLALVAVRPAHLLDPGFQLSFAGAAGLVAWAGPLTARLGRVRAMPRDLASALAAGVAATLATLPVVAWHFERVSLVGIPVTLAASPLVAAALPGALASVVLSSVAPGPAEFLAGGVDWLLALLAHGTVAAAARPWASVWVPNSWVPVGTAGGALAWVLARALRVGRGRRRRWALCATAGCVVLWPVLASSAGHGTVEIVALDVGQGDAVAVRSPRGRWLLVDAGPPPRSAGPSAAAAALARRGVVRLEALVLTHPDLDHVGGAGDVLRRVRVATVLDPARAAGKDGYVDALDAALGAGVPWRAAGDGRDFRLDGMEVTVLHPPPPDDAAPAPTNALSVVLLVRYGAFTALLTGDAPSSVERSLVAAGRVPELAVLKVGHHGSATSTDGRLLAAARPRVAVVSAGRNNRYGHPHAAVLARLHGAGALVLRTDRDGAVRIVGRRDGSFRASVAAGREVEMPAAGHGAAATRADSVPAGRR